MNDENKTKNRDEIIDYKRKAPCLLPKPSHERPIVKIHLAALTRILRCTEEKNMMKEDLDQLNVNTGADTETEKFNFGVSQN